MDDHDPSHVCDHPKTLGVVNTLHFTEFWCQNQVFTAMFPTFLSSPVTSRPLAFQVVTLSPEAVSGGVSCLANRGSWRFRKRLKFPEDPIG